MKLEKEVMFSVNQVQDQTIFSLRQRRSFLDDVYANKPKDLVVTEVNVDSLVFNGISYGLDGTKKELKAGSDYTVNKAAAKVHGKNIHTRSKKKTLKKKAATVLRSTRKTRRQIR